MKKTRYTESQIVKALKEVEGGRNIKDLCREMEVSEATYYNWRSKYGGMEASDVKKMKDLEAENRKLKDPYAERRELSWPQRGLVCLAAKGG